MKVYEKYVRNPVDSPDICITLEIFGFILLKTMRGKRMRGTCGERHDPFFPRRFGVRLSKKHTWVAFSTFEEGFDIHTRPRMGGNDARSRRAKRAAATAVVAAAGLGFGVAALGLGAAALAAGEWRHRRDGRGAFAAASPGRRRRPLSDREWRGAIDREGRVVEDKFASVLRRAASDGVAPEIRPEVWPLLLGVRRPESTAVEQEQRRRRRRARYDALLERRDELERVLSSPTAGSPSLGLRSGRASPGTPARSAGTSLTTRAFRSREAFAAADVAPSPDAGHAQNTKARHLATYAESVPVIRADVPRTAFVPGGAFETHWRLERDAARDAGSASRVLDSTRLRKGETENVPTWRAAQSARLTRALAAYALHDPDVGYCQGMNEVAARFLENVVDESEAFWCFAAFLEAYRPHFIIAERRDPAAAAKPRGPSALRDARDAKKSSRESVRDVLRDLGVVLRRCDPPLWKHVRLLHAQECMFAFRAVVVLLARELPPPETTFLWEALMASGDHLAGSRGDARAKSASEEGNEVASDDDDADDGDDDDDDAEAETREDGSRTKTRVRSRHARRRPVVEPGGAGDGRMLLHCVAAVFVQARHLVFGCREFDDLLHAAHHAVSAKCGAAAPLLESARRLMAQPWRGGADARRVLEE